MTRNDGAQSLPFSIDDAIGHLLPASQVKLNVGEPQSQAVK